MAPRLRVRLLRGPLRVQGKVGKYFEISERNTLGNAKAELNGTNLDFPKRRRRSEGTYCERQSMSTIDN
eukprot:7004116-Pyramimonas_sp.AAC.1